VFDSSGKSVRPGSLYLSQLAERLGAGALKNIGYDYEEQAPILWSAAALQETPRWTLADNGSIVWEIDNRIPHNDHIEMSGKQLSVVLRYSQRR
jgi:hypothetical protein